MRFTFRISVNLQNFPDEFSVKNSNTLSGRASLYFAEISIILESEKERAAAAVASSASELGFHAEDELESNVNRQEDLKARAARIAAEDDVTTAKAQSGAVL